MNEDRKVEGRKEEMNEDTKVKKIGVETGVRDSACEVFTGWWCTRTIRAKVRRGRLGQHARRPVLVLWCPCL